MLARLVLRRTEQRFTEAARLVATVCAEVARDLH